MEALLCLTKRMNPQKINVSKSKNMLIHLLFTHFITKPKKKNVKFLGAPNKNIAPHYFFQLQLRKNNGKRLGT
jgi:hypothetical protein